MGNFKGVIRMFDEPNVEKIEITEEQIDELKMGRDLMYRFDDNLIVIRKQREKIPKYCSYCGEYSLNTERVKNEIENVYYQMCRKCAEWGVIDGEE